MSKRSVLTHVTPLPASITRDAAVRVLHNHGGMIKLNPLVQDYVPTAAHAGASKEEAQYMEWYEITDEIVYIPGTPMKGEIKYKAGFYNLPNGLQTMSFAPGGVQLSGKWTVGGNMPDEPREPVEIGVDKPREGLYLKEEVVLKCSIFLSSFVKKNLKKAHPQIHAVLVKRLLEAVGDDRTHVEKPGTPMSWQSDSALSVQNSHEVFPSPRQSQSNGYGAPAAGYANQQRTGTNCSCTGGKHAIACPYYSRTYQPPSIEDPNGRQASNAQAQGLGRVEGAVGPAPGHAYTPFNTTTPFSVQQSDSQDAATAHRYYEYRAGQIAELA